MSEQSYCNEPFVSEQSTNLVPSLLTVLSPVICLILLLLSTTAKGLLLLLSAMLL